jgi:hypothetical protein
MKIVIVTPTQAHGPMHIKYGADDVFFRSYLSGLMSVKADILILAPGLSDEQRQTALEHTASTLLNSRVYDLVEVETHASKMRKQCEWAAAEVATWPKWKQNILEDSAKPTRDTPRPPVQLDSRQS